MLLSKMSGLGLGAGMGWRGVRCGLLASASVAALLVAGAGSAARANDATVGGVNVPIFPGYNQSPVAIWVPLPAAPTVVNINTDSLSGPYNAIWVTGSIADTTVSVSPGLSVTSTLGWGTAVSATTGNILIDNGGTIDGRLHAIYAPGLTGSTTINSAGVLTSSTQDGIFATTTTGNIIADGKGTGSITAAYNGVEMNTASLAAGQGLITVKNFTGGITGGVDGISANFGTGGTLGDVLITNNGPIKGTLRNGVETYSFGKTTITDNGDVTGAINGIAANFGFASPGDVLISGNKNITGGATGSGIVAGSGTGNIDILGNGITTGGTGIWAVASLGGNVNVTTDKKVTGTTVDGILAQTSGAGAIKVDVKAGDVTGLIYGIDTRNFGTGGTMVNIAAGSTVMGSTDGVATGSLPGGGVATTNNLGIIKNTNDTGAANTNGAFAYFASNGDNVLNNDGQVIGGIFTNVLGSATINNNAAGVWKPIANVAVNAFTVNDTVNNAGLIDVRTGITTFKDLGAFKNKAGGVIDMTYGGSGAAVNAKDSLNVFNFSPLDASKIKLNVDFTLANSTGTEALLNDHSSNGLGTADTIVVYGVGTPAGVSVVDMAVVGGAATGTSGSIALVNAVVGGLADPGLGGTATKVVSDNYVMANGPAGGGAVDYWLQEDANGGVYLQWAPNVSAASLGGFGGATGVGSGPGAPSAGTAIAAASGSLGGAGGFGLSGGPGGGGAAGAVADLAAGDVGSSTTQRGSIKDDATSNCNGDHKRFHGWAQVGASRGSSEGGGSNRDTNLSSGTETAATIATDRGCDRIAVGVFGYRGWSEATWMTGGTSGTSQGLGAYIRASTQAGLYGSLLASAGWTNEQLANSAYNSTADKDGTTRSVVASLGITGKLSPSDAIDLRTFVALGQADSNGFKDSAGIVVSNTHDDLKTVGASIGVTGKLSGGLAAFARAGVKWAEVASSITAFGITQSGKAGAMGYSGEVGITGQLANGVDVSLSAFGDASQGSSSYGGNARVGEKF